MFLGIQAIGGDIEHRGSVQTGSILVESIYEEFDSKPYKLQKSTSAHSEVLYTEESDTNSYEVLMN